MLSEVKQIDLYEDVSNPLDGIEEIMLNNDWNFDRLTEDELTVMVTGKMGNYRMMFVWQDDYSALQFCCAPDISINVDKIGETSKIINKINAELWLGHFDVRPPEKGDKDGLVPCFRHTSLFRGMVESSGIGHMEDLIDIALSECERFYLTFDLLARSGNQNKDENCTQIDPEIALAMMDIAGRS